MKQKIILLILLCIIILSSNNVAHAKREWSEWSDVMPPSGTSMESKTEYRYKTMIKTTSHEPSLAGYVCSGSMWVQTGSGSVDYITSFPTGFNMGSPFYSKYNIQPIKESETATNKTTVSNQTIAYLYYHWCRNGNYTGSLKNRTVSGVYTEKFWNFHAFTTNTPLGWDNKGAFFCDISHCNDTYWWIGHGEGNAANIPINRCSYVNYRKLFSYYKWSEYSNWSVLKPTESDERFVEERKVYRYLKETKKDAKKSKKKYKVGGIITSKRIKYKIKSLKEKKGTVEVKSVLSKKEKQLVLPKRIKVNGYSLTIVGIGKKAFSNCKQVKTIKIKAETLKYVHKRAFSGIKNRDCKIVVPKKCLKRYRKIFSS